MTKTLTSCIKDPAIIRHQHLIWHLPKVVLLVASSLLLGCGQEAPPSSGSVNDDAWTPILGDPAVEVRGLPTRTRNVGNTDSLAVKEEFIIRNASSKTIEFNSLVNASCGCSSVELSRTTLPPDSTTTLSAIIAPPHVGPPLTVHLHLMLLRPVVTPIHLRVILDPESDWAPAVSMVRLHGVVGDTVSGVIPFKYYGEPPDVQLIRPDAGDNDRVKVINSSRAEFVFALTLDSEHQTTKQFELFAPGVRPERWKGDLIIIPLPPAKWEPSVARIVPNRKYSLDLVLAEGANLIDVSSNDDTIAVTPVTKSLLDHEYVKTFTIRGKTRMSAREDTPRYIVAHVRYKDTTYSPILTILGEG